MKTHLRYWLRLFFWLALWSMTAACSPLATRKSTSEGSEKPGKGAITWESG